MGQTLSHGVYLPNEGERNCYAGLASNWQILNTAVGNIAEKAPLVHTHGNITSDGKVGTTANKPLITGTGGAVQAGSFGNQANTFCEGNDSRLSDARTPVAHTHGNIANDGKLANGNRAVITGSDKAITESSVTDTELGYLAGVTSAIQTQLNAKATDADVVHKSGNESIEGKKTFTDSVFCKGPYFLWTNANVVKGTVPQTTIQPYRMYFGNAQNYASSLFNIDPTVGNDGTQTFTFRAAENVVNGDDARFALVYNPNRTQPRYLYIKGDIEPNATNSYDLGSSSYQWNNLYAKKVNTQSVNGVNPGALSLPDYSKASNIDTTNWNKNGTLTSYTPTMNGWLQITLPDDVDNNGKYTNKIIILDSTAPNPITGQASATVGDIRIYLTYPVIANRTYSLYIKSYSNTISAARFIPCQGNV